jgi:hypothetical protein
MIERDCAAGAKGVPSQNEIEKLLDSQTEINIAEKIPTLNGLATLFFADCTVMSQQAQVETLLRTHSIVSIEFTEEFAIGTPFVLK